jgi:hypothetical protein
MPLNARLFVAGSRSASGIAIRRDLHRQRLTSVSSRKRLDLDLPDAGAIPELRTTNRPSPGLAVSTKVGGI